MMLIERHESTISEKERQLSIPVARSEVDAETIQIPVTALSIEPDPCTVAFPDASRSDVFLLERSFRSLSRKTKEDRAEALKQQLLARVMLQRELRQISRDIQSE